MLPAGKTGQRGGTHESIQCDGHELRGMLRAGGKGSQQGTGRDELLGESADEFHGRGRNGKRAGDHPRRRAGGLRCKRKGCGKSGAKLYAGGGKAAGGSRDAEAQEKAVLVSGLLAGPDVYFHGAHDVGLAASLVF